MRKQYDRLNNLSRNFLYSLNFICSLWSNFGLWTYLFFILFFFIPLKKAHSQFFLFTYVVVGKHLRVRPIRHSKDVLAFDPWIMNGLCMDISPGFSSISIALVVSSSSRLIARSSTYLLISIFFHFWRFEKSLVLCAWYYSHACIVFIWGCPC